MRPPSARLPGFPCCPSGRCPSSVQQDRKSLPQETAVRTPELRPGPHGPAHSRCLGHNPSSSLSLGTGGAGGPGSWDQESVPNQGGERGPEAHTWAEPGEAEREIHAAQTRQVSVPSRVHQGPSWRVGERLEVYTSCQAQLGSGQPQARRLGSPNPLGLTKAQQPVWQGPSLHQCPGRKWSTEKSNSSPGSHS